MRKTYLLTLDGKPMVYVFDEDGSVSYTPVAEERPIKEFLKRMFMTRSRMCRQMYAQMDYSAAGYLVMSMLYTIATFTDSESLLGYLLRFREKCSVVGIGLKVKNCIVEEWYYSQHRVTKDKAERELSSMGKYC